MSALARAAAACVIGVALATAPAIAEDACSVPAKPVTDIGKVMPLGTVLDRGLTPISFNEPGRDTIRYFRALVVVSSPAQATWHLTIRDQQQRILETMSSVHLASGKAKWTKRLEGRNPVYFDLETSSPQVQIELKRAILMPESAERPYYSTQQPGVYQFADIETAPSEKKVLGDYVGFVMSSWDKRSWCCSGVAVGDDLFLTNWHCGGDADRMDAAGFWSREVCESTIIDMSWDGDANDREFICTEVVDKDRANDWALLRVKPLRGEDVLRKPAIRAGSIGANDRIAIVHHPACRRKQVSLACDVRNSSYPGWMAGSRGDFTHRCDTEGGSSGSPVFDDRNRLAGLHHLGFDTPGGVCDKLNKAIHIQSIIDSMRPEVSARMKALIR